MPSTKYVSGQVKPSTDVWSPWYFERIWPDCASGEERGAVVSRAARRRDRRSARVASPGGNASTVCRRVAAALAGGSLSASTAAFTPMCSRSAYVPACDEPPDDAVPDLERE